MTKYFLAIEYGKTGEGYDDWVRLISEYNTLQDLIENLKENYSEEDVFEGFESMETEADVEKFINTLINEYEDTASVFIFQKITDGNKYSIIYHNN